MPFVTQKSTQYANKPVYLKTSPGQHVIRMLDDGETALEVWTHWFGMSVACLGENCPQCEQNRMIKIQNPDNYQKVNGYNGSQRRYYANVLDRTPVKVCPKCGEEVGAINNVFPNACPECNTMLMNTSATPSNKVKVLNKGRETFETLDVLESTVLDEKGEPRGIKNFDINLIVVGKNKAPVLTATNNFDPVEVDPDQLYDLANLVVKLSDEEMADVMRGTSLRDIFSARKARSAADKVEAPAFEADADRTKRIAAARQQIDSLFG